VEHKIIILKNVSFLVHKSKVKVFKKHHCDFSYWCCR